MEMQTMKDKIETVLLVIEFIFLVWFLLSYGEVLMKNLNGNPEYGALNLFKVFGLMEGLD